MKRRTQKRIYTVSFISDYGKLWELDYTMEGDTVDEILTARINGIEYKIKTESRSDMIYRIAEKRDVPFYDNSREWDYEHSETHHMVDNF